MYFVWLMVYLLFVCFYFLLKNFGNFVIYVYVSMIIPLNYI